MTIKKIRKRDGRIVNFNKQKIVDAIFNAAVEVGGSDKELSHNLAGLVVELLEQRFPNGEIPSVEDVQDAVEKTLIENGHAKTAKAYILYRDKRARARDSKHLMMNIKELTDGYLSRADWRVKENSNTTYSLSGLMMHVTGAVLANYTLSNVYPRHVSSAHRKGDIHIHDLGMGISGYCAGWSLRQLLEEGFNGVPGKIDSKPPKHLDSALWQMINFIGTLQNEWAGAQAFSSFDTFLSPFIKADDLDYEDVKQAVQGFIFNMNVPSRWGGQTPFSNLTFDWVVPEDLKDQPAIVGGEEQDFTYGDCQEEMDVINKAFLEVMMEGDANGRVFTFPIPTYNITKNFNWGSENAELLFEMTARYGTPYFQNFVNSDLNPSDIRSMCCRLQMDMRELRKRGNGLFGAAEMTGSIGVVTLNMARIGYLAKNEQDYMKRVGELMGLAKKSLEIKRKVVNKNLEGGLMPFSKRYLGTLKNHFSTIGLNGMNESMRNFMGKDLSEEEAIEFTKKVLAFMREKIKHFQEETGHMYNLEATPAEGVSYRFAKKDKELLGDIVVANEEECEKGADPYYTNSTALPVNHTDDLFEAMELQDDIQSMYTGGTVFHAFLKENINSGLVCKKLVKKIAENFRMPYFTITPTFSICPVHGYLKGKVWNCPKEHSESQLENWGVKNEVGTVVPCEVFSRVVGYFRPVQQWNDGKRSEFQHREEFSNKKLVNKVGAEQ